MVTLHELSEKLKKRNVEAVAKAAGVSTKTIYRIRAGSRHSPNLRTVERIVQALKQREAA